MPKEPGADLLEVGVMASVTSDSVMGGKSWVGKGGGSSGWMGATWGWSDMKKHCWRALLISVGLCERVACEVRSGGMRLIDRPFLHVAASQRFSEVVWWRKSWAH